MIQANVNFKPVMSHQHFNTVIGAKVFPAGRIQSALEEQLTFAAISS